MGGNYRGQGDLLFYVITRNGYVVVIHEPIKVWKTSCNRNDNKGREESQIAQFWETVVYEWPLSSKSFVFPLNMDDLKRIFQLLMCLRKISALELSTSFKVTRVNKVHNSKNPFYLCNVQTGRSSTKVVSVHI